MTNQFIGDEKWAVLTASADNASRLCRSMLLVPSSVPRMIEKSRASLADVIVFDLEDSVPVKDKESARKNISIARESGTFAARHHAVKINGPETEWCADDIAFVIQEGIETILLPTDHGWPEIEAVERQLAGAAIKILAAIESPEGILSLPNIASGARHVAGLVLGPWDYTMSLGAYDRVSALDPAINDEHLWHPRQLLLTHARAKGWLAIDSPFGVDAKDQAAVEAAARRSRQRGFDGCITFSPPTVNLFNKAFTPSDRDLEWAVEVERAYENREPGRTAVVTASGTKYLHHHYRAAKQLIRRAALCGKQALK